MASALEPWQGYSGATGFGRSQCLSMGRGISPLLPLLLACWLRTRWCWEAGPTQQCVTLETTQHPLQVLGSEGAQACFSRSFRCN